MKTEHKTILALAATVAVFCANADDRYWQTATDGEGGESMSERLAGSCRHIICGGGRGEGAVQRGRV